MSKVTNAIWPATAILNFGRHIEFRGWNQKHPLSEIDTYIPFNMCANFVAFIQKCKIVVIFQAMPPH